MEIIEAESGEIEFENLINKAKTENILDQLFQFMGKVISFYEFSNKAKLRRKDHPFTISENELCDEIIESINLMMENKEKDALFIFEKFPLRSEQLMIISLIASTFLEKNKK